MYETYNRNWRDHERRGGRGRDDFDRFDRVAREERSFGGSRRLPRDRRPQDRSYDYGERDNYRFGNRDENRRIPRDETQRLISSTKVEGTPVFDRDGDRLGTIENFMVDKRSGKVEYAVLSFGGFMGMGERHYPLPWDELTFDERFGGYVVDITERDLDRAPSHRAGEEPQFERGYARDINTYYYGF